MPPCPRSPAYWVSGDTGVEQPTEAAWAAVELVAEEIAVIVPIPEQVVDDADFDVWGELRPALAEAVAIVLGSAVFGGINKPASWTSPAIAPGAVAAGNAVELGTAAAAGGVERARKTWICEVVLSRCCLEISLSLATARWRAA